MENLDLYKVLSNIKEEQGSSDLTSELEECLVGWGNTKAGFGEFNNILINYDIEIEDYLNLDK